MLDQANPEGMQPMVRTYTGPGERCTEEGAAKRSCYGLTTAVHSPFPLHHSGGGRGGRNEGMKSSLGRGGIEESGVLIFFFSLTIQIYFIWQ